MNKAYDIKAMMLATVAFLVHLAFWLLSNHHWMKKVTKKKMKSENITQALRITVLGYSKAEIKILGLSFPQVAH